MTDKPIKNIVQEILQAQGLPLPIYEYTPHSDGCCITWSACAKIGDITYHSQKTNHKTRKDASSDCAEVIYRVLKTNEATTIAPQSSSSVVVSHSNPMCYSIWVDLDNSRHLWNEIVKAHANGVIGITLLRGFGGPRLDKKDLRGIENISTITSTPTHLKDSADYALFADVLLYVNENKAVITDNDHLMIISGDASLETACYTLKTLYPHISVKYAAKKADIFD